MIGWRLAGLLAAWALMLGVASADQYVVCIATSGAQCGDTCQNKPAESVNAAVFVEMDQNQSTAFRCDPDGTNCARPIHADTFVSDSVIGLSSADRGWMMRVNRTTGEFIEIATLLDSAVIHQGQCRLE